MTSAAQIGIIGYGAIGCDLCDRLSREGYRVVLLLRAGSASRERASPGVRVVDTVEALIALRPQLVVEAAGQAVLERMAESILRAGVPLIAASTGALGDPRLFSRLEAAAREAKTQLILPAGALGGLDYLAALRGVSDVTIRYTSRKPPAAWQAELAAAGHDPARLGGEIVLFEGAPGQAAQLYPRNLNAGLTVALAAAPAPVTVRVIADPAVSLNTHEIEAESALGMAYMRFANRPSADNPKTSALTAASLAATVRRLLEPVMR
jgi:aspartate dehydrogenase